MRSVRVEELEVGDRVARDVPSGAAGSVPLLRAGTRISAAYLAALARSGVTGVYIDDEFGAGIEPEEPLSEPTRRAALEALEKTVAEASLAAAGGSNLSEQTLSELAGIVRLINAEIADCRVAALALTDLAGSDHYTLQHSIDVTVIGLLIGRSHIRTHGWRDYRGKTRHDRINDQMTKLGVGLLLHDIGKLGVPKEILEKPGRLDPHEFEIVKQHPALGRRMLEGTDVLSPLSVAVVTQHHERWNGSGYPRRLAGGQIVEFARIAAVADVHDAITSERPYRAARPVSEAYRTVLDGAGSLFDPQVVESYQKVVAPYPLGTSVTLSDGRRGIVSSVPDRELSRPEVRVVQDADGRPCTWEQVALSGRLDLQIVDAGFGLDAT
jgi:HD-GYP domain-containing protein (c-di-GMP phosphodiesterase class II)